MATPVTTTPEALVSNEGALTSPVKLPVTLPVTLPVKFPEKPLVAVTTPEATTLVNEMFGSRLIVTVFEAAEEVRFVPPEIVRASESKLIFSEPLSPVTVKAVPTEAVDTAVTRPLALTVTTGICVCEPNVPTLLLTVASVTARPTLAVPSNDTEAEAASPVTWKLRAV